MADKKRRTRAPVKRRYKVRVIAQPLPITPTPTVAVNSTPTVPTPTVATTATIMPMVKSAAMSILVMVYNLAKGKLEGVNYPTGRPQSEEIPSSLNFNPLQPEAIPNAPTFQGREDTPWPNTLPASTYLFKARADWPIPPMQTPTVKVEKAEVPCRVTVIPHVMVIPKPQNNKQIEEKCTWRPHCPICKNEEEEGMEDWNGDRQEVR